MKFYIFLIISFIISFLQTDPVQESDLEGNWQSFTDGGENIYTEFYFHGDTIERFNLNWSLLPLVKYRIENDCLKTTNKTYKIEIHNNNSIDLISKLDTIHLQRMNTDKKTIEHLLIEGLFDKDLPDSVFYKGFNSFVSEVFRVREVEFKIQHGMLNRDTLVNYWKSQLIEDTLNQDLYQLWIDEIDKN